MIVRRAAIALGLATWLVSCATPPTAPGPAVADLTPTGKLRAAINFGNPVLASKDPSTGDPRGVSVDLSRELAKRLGVPLEIVRKPGMSRISRSIPRGRSTSTTPRRTS
jgi:polar amino acid transport system substrate-binding protein